MAHGHAIRQSRALRRRTGTHVSPVSNFLPPRHATVVLGAWDSQQKDLDLEFWDLGPWSPVSLVDCDRL